jgi:hypothetical protein
MDMKLVRDQKRRENVAYRKKKVRLYYRQQKSVQLIV